MTALIITLIICLTILCAICAICYTLWRVDQSDTWRNVLAVRDEVARMREEWRAWKDQAS